MRSPTHAHRLDINPLLFALAALGVALLFALLVGGARSASQRGGLIAFTRHDGIYVMRPDGGGVRPLRRGAVASSAFGLAWSPDGRTLAFRTAGESRGIWVMSADGTRLVRLAFPGEIKPFSSPTWSPDGRRIAFSAVRDDRPSGIWVMNVDGSNLQRLARTGVLASEVDWSPAGGRIAFTRAGYVPLLYVMNANGGKLRKVFVPVAGTPRAVLALEPRWSPDGRRIALVGWQNGHLEDEIYVIDPSGRSLVQLTSNEVMDYHPVWSPDGSRIAFLRSDEEECWFKCPTEKRASGEIYVMNADGSGVTRLTDNDLGEGSPAWQPVTAR